ncbi:hypothetical protein C5C66_07490 [Rathayibacter toxicus]|nr:hypothetical protein APU90_09435 [Rathayibacter toxicus]PPH22561.1 hypothetical protein C5D17_07490 [Rathayibacter toxicus]PPH59455.1 hypothetical protein C5C93_07520 [Rathayibacter toxicus]PPH62906.1 hypothetical protein C5D13_07540 [Rathayibacter toxicus]PPH80876.1 hypothetical protein C5D20_07510 [Rathayibacter toxicus]
MACACGTLKSADMTQYFIAFTKSLDNGHTDGITAIGTITVHEPHSHADYGEDLFVGQRRIDTGEEHHVAIVSHPGDNDRTLTFPGPLP